MNRISLLIRVVFPAFFLLNISLLSTAQSVNKQEEIVKIARMDLESLSAPEMMGRGYQKEGHIKAANYIAARFSEIGLSGIPEKEGEARFFQPFSLTLNRIDSAALYINGVKMRLGYDYIMHPGSGGRKAAGKIQDLGYGLPYEYKKVKPMIAVMRDGIPEKVQKKPDLKEKYSDFGSVDAKVTLAAKANLPAVVFLKQKLTAGLSAMPYEFPVIEVLESSWPRKAKSLEITLDRQFKKIESQNVVGVIEGRLDPEQVIIISAHYDHLGKMGEAIFFGANDNASGIATLLSLAEHFSKPENVPDYTLVFIAFGGEEAGLIGSRYYVEREPLFRLDQTRFILNLDLMGNGDEGITAVGGLDDEPNFQLLNSLNDSLEAVTLIKGRHNVPNSDHYFFLVNGVKGFFIYTLGGPKHYHDVFDKASEVRFPKFLEIRSLLIAFLDRL